MTQIRLLTPSPEPATHVLVIGVGYYRHLLEGPEPRKRVHLGLSVLESPPRSAEKFVNSLLGIDPALPGRPLNNPAAPLATLEVLISGRAPATFNVSGTAHTAEAASLPAVRTAFDRWLAEVESHPDNVGVIYFCGHGVMGNGPEHYLLLEDHGATENRPFETGSFDFTTTLRALLRRVPAQLYAFVDACRKYERLLADKMGAQPAPLLQEGASTRTVNLGHTLIEATGEGRAAYGDSVDVSRFTDALLRALKGYCGVPQPGSANWLVNGEALTQAMPKLLALVNKERKGEAQFCQPHPSGQRDLPFHLLAEPPKVKVEIEVLTGKNQPLGEYTMNDLLRKREPPLIGGGTPGPWQIEAVRSTYRIRVQSRTNAFEDYDSGAQYVDPPTYRLEVPR